MPIIHYQCFKCEKKFELFQKITDEPIKKCSFCGGKCATVPAGFVAKVLKLPLPKKKAAAVSKKTTVKMIKKVEKKVARGGKKGR